MTLAILYRDELSDYDFGPGHPFRGDRYRSGGTLNGGGVKGWEGKVGFPLQGVYQTPSSLKIVQQNAGASI